MHKLYKGWGPAIRDGSVVELPGRLVYGWT